MTSSYIGNVGILLSPRNQACISVDKHSSIRVSTSSSVTTSAAATTTTTIHKSKEERGIGKRVWRIRACGGENMATTSTSEVEERLGVKIQRNPPESKLSQLGVRNWPKWGCPPSKFPWTYSSKETCYLLKGKVKVYPDGSDEAVEFGAGDLVEFPNGMSCTWDVSETVDKHYMFE